MNNKTESSDQTGAAKGVSAIPMDKQTSKSGG